MSAKSAKSHDDLLKLKIDAPREEIREANLPVTPQDYIKPPEVTPPKDEKKDK